MKRPPVSMSGGDEAPAGGGRSAGEWLLQGELGAGSFARVWRAMHRGSGQVAAVKEINLEKLNRKLQESLASEVAVLNAARGHPHIVGLLDLIRVRLRWHLVLPLCLGPAADMLSHILHDW